MNAKEHLEYDNKFWKDYHECLHCKHNEKYQCLKADETRGHLCFERVENDNVSEIYNMGRLRYQ